MEPPARRELADNLFRQEAGKMTAVLARVLGLGNVDLAEDVVHDTLCFALDAWRYGLPDNPAAWLMRVAKNRAIDLIRRERTRRRFAPDIAELLATEWTLHSTVEKAFFGSEITDEQLRMMFACCAGDLRPNVSAALILKLLCGFGVREIAAAFLSTTDAIEKQLARGKAALREQGELRDDAARERLPAVESALYLLFNEGYHGTHPELAVRAELCAEAIRLASLLARRYGDEVPRVHALCALMCLQAARLPARLDGAGELVLLENQDRTLWDSALTTRGLDHLARSAAGDEVSELHIEAAIASKHAVARSLDDTDWDAICHLYDLLVRLNPSPVVALNRAIAVAQLEGREAGLAAIGTIPDRERLADYLFYHLALAELSPRDSALASLERARSLARNPAEARLVERKLAALGGDG